MYFEKFIENGFEDMQILGELGAGVLGGMGVKAGHQIKLRKCLGERGNDRKTGEGFRCGEGIEN